MAAGKECGILCLNDSTFSWLVPSGQQKITWGAEKGDWLITVTDANGKSTYLDSDGQPAFSFPGWTQWRRVENKEIDGYDYVSQSVNNGYHLYWAAKNSSDKYFTHIVNEKGIPVVNVGTTKTIVVIVAVGTTFSCNSKEKQLQEQQMADSLRRDSIHKQQQADSIAKAKEEAELNDKKIEFLKSVYKNVVYPQDIGPNTTDYGSKLAKHISPKVAKAMTDYDDGMDAEYSTPGPKLYLLGDEGDYDGVPDITYTYLGDNWFEARIGKQTTVRIRVESEPDDDESFVITGLVNKNYGINVK